MRTLRTTFAALALAAVLTCPALAQQTKGFGRGGGFGGPGMLLGNASVQKELKLDDSQVEKANKFAEEGRAKMREVFSSLQGLEGEERATKMREIQKTQGEEARKVITEILKPEQAKRFRQISLQQQSVNALAHNPQVQKELNVTDEQKEKLQTILREGEEKARGIRESANGDFEVMREKMTAFRKEQADKADAVLTDGQKKEWKEMLGDPFQVQFERRPNN